MTVTIKHHEGAENILNELSGFRGWYVINEQPGQFSITTDDDVSELSTLQEQSLNAHPEITEWDC